MNLKNCNRFDLISHVKIDPEFFLDAQTALQGRRIDEKTIEIIKVEANRGVASGKIEIGEFSEFDVAPEDPDTLAVEALLARLKATETLETSPWMADILMNALAYDEIFLKLSTYYCNAPLQEEAGVPHFHNTSARFALSRLGKPQDEPGFG